MEENAETASIIHAPEFWIAVAFVLFAGVFMKFVWPHIVKMLDSRATTIRRQLEQASNLRAEAEALLASYQKEREEKTREAEAIVTAAKKDAEELRARAASELTQSLERRSQQALEKIARAEADATAFIRAQMIDIASQAVTEIIRTELETKKQEDPAIERAITAIEQQIH